MNKFEKIAKKAELLECAYNAIIDRDKWDNMVDAWAENPELKPDKAEMHSYYLEIASLIEGLIGK